MSGGSITCRSEPGGESGNQPDPRRSTAAARSVTRWCRWSVSSSPASSTRCAGPQHHGAGDLGVATGQRVGRDLKDAGKTGCSHSGLHHRGTRAVDNGLKRFRRQEVRHDVELRLWYSRRCSAPSIERDQRRADHRLAASTAPRPSGVSGAPGGQPLPAARRRCEPPG
jgi:hypothetical protein